MIGNIIRESAQLAGQKGYRAPSVWRDLGVITSQKRHRFLFWAPSNLPHCQLSVVDSSFAWWRFPQPIPTICHNSDKGGVADSPQPVPVFSYLQMAKCWRGLVPLCFICIAWPGFNKAVVAKLCFPNGAFLQSKNIHLPFALPLVQPFWHSLVLFFPSQSLPSHSSIPSIVSHLYHKIGPHVGICRHPLMCRVFQIYYTRVYESVLIKRWNH